MGLRLFERIRKLRLPRRRKTERQMPVLPWQKLDQDDERELLQQVQEDGEQEAIVLQEAMRGPN